MLMLRLPITPCSRILCATPMGFGSELTWSALGTESGRSTPGMHAGVHVLVVMASRKYCSVVYPLIF